jgi:hypothetical protein
MMQKAQDLKQKKNLEKGTKYSSSFAFVRNSTSCDKANNVSIDLVLISWKLMKPLMV